MNFLQSKKLVSFMTVLQHSNMQVTVISHKILDFTLLRNLPKLTKKASNQPVVSIITCYLYSYSYIFYLSLKIARNCHCSIYFTVPSISVFHTFHRHIGIFKISVRLYLTVICDTLFNEWLSC